MTKNTKLKRSDRRKKVYLKLKEKRESGKTLTTSESIEYDSLKRRLGIVDRARPTLTKTLSGDILIEIDYKASTGQKDLVVKPVVLSDQE